MKDRYEKTGKRYRVAARQILGTREEQQDDFTVVVEDDYLMAAVCDGMGGMNGGSMASRLAVETIQSGFSDYHYGDGAAGFLANMLHAADDKIALLRDESGGLLKAGTTAVAVLLEREQLYWVSVGDSRLYIMRDGGDVQATRDHNYRWQLNELLKKNCITEKEYDEEACQGEALVSYVGIGGITIMDISREPFELQQGDRLLLCSDGLYKTVPHTDIVQIVSEITDLGRAANALLSRVSRYDMNCKQDNATFILIEMI